MGYSTEFQGGFEIVNITDEKRSCLDQYLGRDLRDIGVYDTRFNHVDLMWKDDTRTTLVWNGAEKTRGMADILNWMIDVASLELKGSMECQGEEMSDRYTLVVHISGGITKCEPDVCPHCKRKL